MNEPNSLAVGGPLDATVKPLLARCPFCGHAKAPMLTSAEELHREDDDDSPWPHSDSWAVICDASRPDGRGGCGAMGGFFPTEQQAAEKWNARRTPGYVFAGWFNELKSGMCYRLWEQGGHDRGPGDVALYEEV